MKLEPIGARAARLGESPVWHPGRSTLFWVDSINRLVIENDLEGRHENTWTVEQEIGSIALAEDGNLVVALEDAIHHLDLATGKTRCLATVAHPRLPMRLNDGKPDRQGRFVVGSMVIGRPDRDALLYRLEPDGRIATLQDSIAIANGVAFSPDGQRLYYADTANYVIYACDYDPASGRTGPRQVLLDTRPLNARPDGATVDAEGCLWSALVDTGQLARIAADGRLVDLVDLGVSFVTCPVFAGPGFDQLILTSLRHTHTMKVDHPLAGRLFRLEGLNVRGISEVPVGLPA